MKISSNCFPNLGFFPSDIIITHISKSIKTENKMIQIQPRSLIVSKQKHSAAPCLPEGRPVHSRSSICSVSDTPGFVLYCWRYGKLGCIILLSGLYIARYFVIVWYFYCPFADRINSIKPFLVQTVNNITRNCLSSSKYSRLISNNRWKLI